LQAAAISGDLGVSVLGAPRLTALAAFPVVAQGLAGNILPTTPPARAAFSKGFSSVIGADFLPRLELDEAFGLDIALISDEKLTSTKREQQNKCGTSGGASSPVENSSTATLVCSAHRAKNTDVLGSHSDFDQYCHSA
jgi:hypothetical protein